MPGAERVTVALWLRDRRSIVVLMLYSPVVLERTKDRLPAPVKIGMLDAEALVVR